MPLDLAVRSDKKHPNDPVDQEDAKDSKRKDCFISTLASRHRIASKYEDIRGVVNTITAKTDDTERTVTRKCRTSGSQRFCGNLSCVEYRCK
jgi:hypothetical protein